MCTVTFYKNNNKEYILTSNRDEKIHRVTLPPTVYTRAETKCVYPKDSKAEGTWIALTDKKMSCCLLNGGLVKHVPKTSYKKSRGLVILDLIAAEDYMSFIIKTDFSAFEPFTLITYENNNLYELKWDGVKTRVKKLAVSGHYIWSSVTLYSKEQSLEKEKKFNLLFESNNRPSSKAIFDLHNATANNEGFLLKTTNLTKTVSISQLTISKNKGNFYYLDLLKQEEIKREIKWIQDTH